MEDPLTLIINKENLQFVVQSIQEMKPIYRDMILLRFAHGHSVKEIAGYLGISEDNVRKRIERAKKMFLNILEKQREEELQ